MTKYSDSWADLMMESKWFLKLIILIWLAVKLKMKPDHVHSFILPVENVEHWDYVCDRIYPHVNVNEDLWVC